MSRRLLLTGATGFVGTQVVRELTSRNIPVTAVVREGRQPPNDIDAIVTTPDLFVESVEWWADVCRGIDTVVHIAWYAEPGKYLQSPRNLDCLSGTLNLARGAAKAGVRRFVGIGTCFEYDLAACRLTIDTPIRPLTLYSGAKAAAYMTLSQWLPLNAVEFCWCRLFYLYGEGEDERRLVPYLHTRIAAGKFAELTNGEQIRDFLDVREAGRLIADATLGVTQGPVNVCSGVPVTVRQLAERVADEYGRRDLLLFGARPDNLVDPPCVVGVRG
jgi:nucleoside-diphosphate-sugar epimerase